MNTTAWFRQIAVIALLAVIALDAGAKINPYVPLPTVSSFSDAVYFGDSAGNALLWPFDIFNPTVLGGTYAVLGQDEEAAGANSATVVFKYFAPFNITNQFIGLYRVDAGSAQPVLSDMITTSLNFFDLFSSPGISVALLSAEAQNAPLDGSLATATLNETGAPQDITQLAFGQTFLDAAQIPLNYPGAVAPGDGEIHLWVISGVADPVPEPDVSAMILAGLGLIGLVGARRKAA
jgi:hypothetical protein